MVSVNYQVISAGNNRSITRRIHMCGELNCVGTGPDPEMLLPGGTGSRSLEPSGESLSPRGQRLESMRGGIEPPLIRGRGASPGKFCKNLLI